MIEHLRHGEKRKYNHVYDEPLQKGILSTCKHCGIKVHPLIDLSYSEFLTKEGEYGDNRYDRLPQCVGKNIATSQ